MENLHSLTLRTPGISGMGTEIYLDDVQIKGTTHINLEIGLNEPNRLTLTLIVDGVNADGFVQVEERGALDARPRAHMASHQRRGRAG